MPIKITKSHLVYMNIGPRYWGSSIDKFSAQQSKAVKEYLDNIKTLLSKGIGLFIWGNNSLGKTYVAAAFCKYVWEQFRVSSYCITASELKEGWISDRIASQDSEETTVQRTETVSFLVIDDLGKEHRATSGFAENKFGALLRHRSRLMKTTVITTNMNPKEFTEVYGSSTAALVKECMKPVKMDGPDMRSKIATNINKLLHL